MAYRYKKVYRVINLDIEFVLFDFLRKEDALKFIKHNTGKYRYELQTYNILKTGRLSRVGSIRY